MDHCFACNRKLPKRHKRAITSDDQLVFVGCACYAHIEHAGRAGYQPPSGGTATLDALVGITVGDQGRHPNAQLFLAYDELTKVCWSLGR